MTRSRRMEPVRRLADDQADAAARDYARRRDALEDEQRKLQQLESYRADYRAGFGQAGGGGMDPHRLRDYAAFLGRIDQALEQQRSAVVRLEAEVRRMREQWLERWGRARALERTVERYRAQERGSERRREQAASDELALRRPRRDWDGR